MVSDKAKWETYEDVAKHLLDEMAEEFGLSKVEGKQKILGLRSGTEWEIEAKGVLIDEEKFLIVECRRYTKSRLSQERIGGLAYRIADAGASGGIIVTPLGLQSGAKKVAEAENIINVLLDADSSSSDYLLRFLEQIKVGVSGEIQPSGTLGIRVIRKDGEIEDLGCV